MATETIAFKPAKLGELELKNYLTFFGVTRCAMIKDMAKMFRPMTILTADTVAVIAIE